MQESRINATITEADKTAALEAINIARTKLPILIDLSPTDKKRMTKFGDDDVATIEQALTLAEQDDSFLPRAFDVAKFREKKEQLRMIGEIRLAAKLFVELLDDTYYALGSESASQALKVYESGKKNGRGSAINALVSDIGRRFKKSSKKKDETGSNG
jgi:hypothetical protein